MIISRKAIISRVLLRYIPAAATIVFSRELLIMGGSDIYSTYALLISFSSLLPIIDLGYGNSIVTSNGSIAELKKGLQYSLIVIAVFLVVSSITMSLGYLKIGPIWSGCFVGMLLLPLYLLSRHVYTVDGPDTFNSRLLLIYPFIWLIILIALYFELIDATHVAVIGALAIVFGSFVFGLRLNNLRLLQEAHLFNYEFNILSVFNLRNRNGHLLLMAVIAFGGAWSNVLFLNYYGSSHEVMEYDLVWRLISVTMFAQLILAHSLPHIVKKLEQENQCSHAMHKSIMTKSAKYTAIQGVVVAIAFIPYFGYYGISINYISLLSGCAMAIVFSWGISCNLISQALRDYKSIHISFIVAAVISISLKLMLSFDGLSATEAFLTTAVAYAVGNILLQRMIFNRPKAT